MLAAITLIAVLGLLVWQQFQPLIMIKPMVMKPTLYGAGLWVWCVPPIIHGHTHAGMFVLQAFYKSARVEYIPVGVVGAIVPWNWPFHNIINPISAAVFAGNAIVIKVCLALSIGQKHPGLTTSETWMNSVYQSYSLCAYTTANSVCLACS